MTVEDRAAVLRLERARSTTHRGWRTALNVEAVDESSLMFRTTQQHHYFDPSSALFYQRKGTQQERSGATTSSSLAVVHAIGYQEKDDKGDKAGATEKRQRLPNTTRSLTLCAKGSVKWSIIDESAAVSAHAGAGTNAKVLGPGQKRRAGVTDLVRQQQAADAFAEALTNAKRKAVREVSAEPGWISEWDDDLVVNARPKLDDRLAWIDGAIARLAPQVRARFRKALVQDEELRRRRRRLKKRALENVEIVGGAGTGAVKGEAEIPALPSSRELSEAAAATQAELKKAMDARLYSRVTALEEQIQAIERRKVEVKAEEDAFARDQREREVAARRAPPRQRWDASAGKYLCAAPLLHSTPTARRRKELRELAY